MKILYVPLILLIIWISWGIISKFYWETPKFDKIDSISNVQIREYPQLLTATAESSGQNSAFRILAKYIFGGNKDNQKIAMTSPVLTQKKGDSTEMVFFFPKDYENRSVPKPIGKVKLSKIEKRKVGVITYWGINTESKFEKNKGNLLNTLKNNNISINGSVFLLQYDDPYVPFFLRKNEVGVQIN